VGGATDPTLVSAQDTTAEETTMTATTPAYDVLVVGAGPSGLATAVAATRAGARVLVVDRHARTSIFPKATGLRPRTMELMRAWGLEEQVRAGAQDLIVAAALSTTLTGPVLEAFPLAGGAGTDDLASLSPTTFALAPQDHLEPVLLAHLRSLGGEVRFGVEVIDLVQDHDEVAIRLRADGEDQTVVARWVVGADGANSTVRGLVGLGVQHLGDEGEHLATLFRADLARHLPGDRYGLHLIVGDGGFRVFAPSGIDGRWVFDREFHPEQGDTVAAWTTERAVGAIRESAGVPDLEVDVLGVFPWCFGAAVATEIEAGRVFLVGDAAHRTTPRGATGMNTGIADGHNLGWKLGWAARGLAGQSLLSTYSEERYPVGLQNALQSLEEGGPENERDLSHDFGVVYVSEAVQPGIDPVALQHGAVTMATPGARAPHAWVSYDGHRLSTVDMLEGRLTLVTGPEGGAWRLAGATVRHRVPLEVRVVGEDVLDLDGDLVDRFRLTGPAAVLVRPDGHVAWMLPGTEPGPELEEALATVLGRDPVPVS